MSTINTEYFIARRLSRKSAGRRNVMVRIATVTVAISVAVMIVAMAVISGFRHAITGKLTGFGGDIQVVNYDGNTSFETEPVRLDPSLYDALARRPGVCNISTYAIKGGIIKTDDAIQGILLKGVGADYDWTFFTDNLTDGRLPVVGDSVRNKDILISRSLASLTGLRPEDRVEMLFIRDDDAPRRDRFKVAGIYETGFDEMDKILVMTDIRNVQRLSGWNTDNITGYEINISDFGRLDMISTDVYRQTTQMQIPGGENLMVLTVEERYPGLFDWLKAHNVNAAVIISIMLLVSLLNMISALLIILLERTRMVGILKSLGMANAALQKMFLMRSGFILITGLLAGNIAGIGLCLIQKYTHIVKLSQAGYFLTEVPVKLEAWWIAALNIGTFALILALLTIPTRIISGINPEKTVRYQ